MAASLGRDHAKQHTSLLKQVYDNINIAAQAGVEIEFSPEGYSHMGDSFNFVTDLIQTAIAAGARIINCPDTIGVHISGQLQSPTTAKDLIMALITKISVHGATGTVIEYTGSAVRALDMAGRKHSAI